jgi:hypothetical protein
MLGNYPEENLQILLLSFGKFNNAVDHSSFGKGSGLGVADRGIKIRFPTGAGN